MSGDLSVSQRSPSIHLLLSKQAVNQSTGTSCLPVPLTSSLESHRCWVLWAAPRTSTHTASFKVKAKFTQSWASTGLPCPLQLCAQIRRLLPGPNIHTQREKKGRKTDRKKKKEGVGNKQWSVITGIICLKSDSVIWKECGCVWVCIGICLMDA